MFGRRKKKPALQKMPPMLVEPLESRTLLSASASAIMTPDIVLHSNAVTLSSVDGFTPAQIRKAYGFDMVSLDGSGQTIAIVDAFNDPNIASDLGVFDAQFGLSAPPSLKIVNQTGGSTLPHADSGWASEISLDVEWAHAIAPQANILLVETTTDDLSNLLAGVKYARGAAGVSVVSISWGGSESFTFGFGESSNQTMYDSDFTTPAGHQGVTFVASAGDSGSGDVEFPASSPNVLSVGGTTLTTQSDGAYVSEQSWSGSSGGYSQVENRPAYQKNAQSTGNRSVPDVAYNADTNTGFAVYDSVPDGGISGWQSVGGTSAGAPQWAALIALADQARVSVGKTTLDGASQTLPLLYSFYSASGTSGYAGYTSKFNDIIDPQSSFPFPFPGRFRGGFRSSSAVAGYDTVTGLGSPKAGAIVDALSGTESFTSGSIPTSTPTPITTASSPITGAFVTSLPASALAGQNGTVKLSLQNTGDTKFSGPVIVTLYASSDDTLSSDDTAVGTLSLPKLTLAAGSSKIVKLKFTYASGLSGSYSLIAAIDAAATSTTASQAVSPSTVAVSPRTVDLATTFASATPIVVTPGAHGTVAVTIQNLGNSVANGVLNLSLYASGDQALDATDVLLGAITNRRIHLRPGGSLTLHVRFTGPLNEVSGGVFLIATAASTTQPGDNNPANDTAVIATV